LQKKSGISKLNPDRSKCTTDSDRDADCSVICSRVDKISLGITLLELIIVVAIVGILASIAAPTYTGYIEKARIQSAIADIKRISLLIERYKSDEGVYPVSLADVGAGDDLDPWGNAYQYLNNEEVIRGEKKGKEKIKCQGCRWDKFERPLNTDFDLYSVGKNGETQQRIDNRQSRDDVIRAHNGAYVGLAEGY
jgi:general secretion pathway protein G